MVAQPTAVFSQPPPPIQQLSQLQQLQHQQLPQLLQPQLQQLKQLPPPSVPPPDLAYEQGLHGVASEVLAEAVLDGCRDVAQQVVREMEAAAEIAKVS